MSLLLRPLATGMLYGLRGNWYLASWYFGLFIVRLTKRVWR